VASTTTKNSRVRNEKVLGRAAFNRRIAYDDCTGVAEDKESAWFRTESGQDLPASQENFAALLRELATVPYNLADECFLHRTDDYIVQNRISLIVTSA